MSSLRDLQRRFAGMLFGEAPEHEADPRVAIYRNNLRAGFVQALALEFPVIQRLVGQDYFRQLAQEFLSEHPSRAGDLHEIGAPFPQYLRGRFAESEYAYLPDVAQLEWAYQQAAVAADAPAFDVQSLARIAPDSYGGLRFNLHPACFQVHSVYPILRIWQVNQTEDSEEIVDLAAGPDHVMTRRAGDSVELRRVSRAEYLLLVCLSAGTTLAEALGAAEQAEPDFDLGRALRQLIALQLITGFQCENLFSNKGILP
jgi:hypothetical protein